MSEAKYILTAEDGSKAIAVYNDTDLLRRINAAVDLGVAVTVRPAKD